MSAGLSLVYTVTVVMSQQCIVGDILMLHLICSIPHRPRVSNMHGKNMYISKKV